MLVKFCDDQATFVLDKCEALRSNAIRALGTGVHSKPQSQGTHLALLDPSLSRTLVTG